MKKNSWTLLDWGIVGHPFPKGVEMEVFRGTGEHWHKLTVNTDFSATRQLLNYRWSSFIEKDYLKG